MGKENIWQILNINETKNQELIKDAYRKQLVHANPEDDAQGFISLRKAYEEAIRLSYEHGSEEYQDEKPKSDIDLWLEQVDDVYQHMPKRLNIGLWEELLKNDVCKSMDTWLEAREKLLAYLMNHFYLPHGAWILFDHEFDIVKDKENLLQLFPEGFIEYAISQIRNYSLMDLGLLTISENEPVDIYIRSYYSIKRMIDENNTTHLQEEFNKIDMWHIYHPYVDTERLRYFMSVNNEAGIKMLLHKLSAYTDDDYINYYMSKAHWFVKNYEEAAEMWEKLCSKYPSHYGARLGLIQYCIYKGRYKEANERAVSLSRTYIRDEEVHKLLTEANEPLIKEYEQDCEAEPDNLKVKEELAWCYYQNSYLDKCTKLLNELPDEVKSEQWFLKLCGYVYVKKNEFEKALEYLLKWLELLKISPEDNDKRWNLCICNYMIGMCFINEKKYEMSIPYLNESASLEENPMERLHIKERISFAFLKAERNEDCIDACDEIIKESKDYYPAYINRQEAFFNMQNAQGVIDNYYRAVEIHAGLLKPYLLAAKMFYFYGQYEDSKDIIHKAKKANLSSNELELYYGKNLRLTAKSSTDKETALKVLKDLYESIYNDMKISEHKNNNDSEAEYSDLGEVLHEIARAYSDLGQLEEGLDSINEAINLKPLDEFYTTKAYIYMDLELYIHAEEVLERQLKVYGNSENILLNLARCYEKTGREEKALTLYQDVLNVNSDNLEALEAIGDIYINLYKRNENVKYYETAISYGEKLLELSPDSSYYHVHVGIMYEQGYEFEKSLICYKKASEYNPEDMWPHNNAGIVLKLMKRYDEAIEEYKIAIELMVQGWSHLPHSNLADCYEILGRYDEAISFYNEILKHKPDTVWVHTEIANILTKMGRYKEAADIYMNMKKKYGMNKYQVFRNIMLIHEASGNLTKSKMYEWKALLSNESPSSKDRDFSDYYFSIGKFHEATDFYSMSVKNESTDSPDYCVPYIGLASVYYDKNKKKKAKLWSEKAMEVIKGTYGDEAAFAAYKPNGALRHYRLGMIYLMLDQHEKAEAYFLNALEHPPCKRCRSSKCFEALYGLGRLYEDKKQLDLAEEHYMAALKYNNSPLYRRRLSTVRKSRKK